MGKQSGVTMVELLIVLVILSIIAVVGTINVSNIVENTRVETDLANLQTLNKATYYYKLFNQNDETFNHAETDIERMTLLVDFGYLSEVIHPKSSKGTFSYDTSTNYWIYSLMNVADESGIDIESINLDDYTKTGSWLVEDQTIISGSGILFIDNPNAEYTITVTAQLAPGSSGGFGVLFETSLVGSSDTGYILQFDRGYGRGSILIRPRTNGSEGSVNQSFVFNHANSIVPDKNTVEGSEWWNQEHTISLVISIIDEVPLTKSLSVYIDGTLLFDNFVFQSTISPTNNFTGVRSWNGINVSYKAIIIEDN